MDSRHSIPQQSLKAAPKVPQTIASSHKQVEAIKTEDAYNYATMKRIKKIKKAASLQQSISATILASYITSCFILLAIFAQSVLAAKRYQNMPQNIYNNNNNNNMNANNANLSPARRNMQPVNDYSADLTNQDRDALMRSHQRHYEGDEPSISPRQMASAYNSPQQQTKGGSMQASNQRYGNDEQDNGADDIDEQSSLDNPLEFKKGLVGQKRVLQNTPQMKAAIENDDAAVDEDYDYDGNSNNKASLVPETRRQFAQHSASNNNNNNNRNKQFAKQPKSYSDNSQLIAASRSFANNANLLPSRSYNQARNEDDEPLSEFESSPQEDLHFSRKPQLATQALANTNLNVNANANLHSSANQASAMPRQYLQSNLQRNIDYGNASNDEDSDADDKDEPFSGEVQPSSMASAASSSHNKIEQMPQQKTSSPTVPSNTNSLNNDANLFFGFRPLAVQSAVAPKSVKVPYNPQDNPSHAGKYFIN